MSLLPLALHVLPIFPGLIESVLKIISAVRDDPATPEEAKAKLLRAANALEEALRVVAAARLPAPPTQADVVR